MYSNFGSYDGLSASAAPTQGQSSNNSSASAPASASQSFGMGDHELYDGLMGVNVHSFQLSNQQQQQQPAQQQQQWNARSYGSHSAAASTATATQSTAYGDRQMQMQNRIQLLEAERTNLEQRLALYKDVIKNNVRADLAARIVDPFEDYASRLCDERMDLVDTFVTAQQRPNWEQAIPNLIRAHCEDTMRLYSSDLLGGEIDRRGFWVWLREARQRHRDVKVSILSVDTDDCSGQHMKVSYEFHGDSAFADKFAAAPESPSKAPTPVHGQGHVFLTFRSTSLAIARQVWVWKATQRIA